MPVKISPRKLSCPWALGYSLDVHTKSSSMIGYNSFGHPVFETVRSPLGELLFRLKNRGDETVIPDIVDTTAEFVKGLNLQIDAVVPVPPSNVNRKRQPVITIAKGLCEALGMPLCLDCVTKIRTTSQLKDVFEFAKRTELLKGAFAVAAQQTRGKRWLLIDDLYRSGATASTIARLLIRDGAARKVYRLTLTQTRRLS